MEVFL
jgi:hypothetical protein